jgi:hypothetical protein
MHLKKLIKSRRGVAMELAIGVMFLMIAFTIMLLSTAGLQNRHRNDDYKDFNQMIEINNVGEHVFGNTDIDYIDNLAEITLYDNDYTVQKAVNEYKIYRGHDLESLEGLDPILTITYDSNGKITSWK